MSETYTQWAARYQKQRQSEQPLEAEVFTCADCGEAMSREAFYRDRSRKTGVHSYCKECSKARSKRNYKAWCNEVEAAQELNEAMRRFPLVSPAAALRAHREHPQRAKREG